MVVGHDRAQELTYHSLLPSPSPGSVSQEAPSTSCSSSLMLNGMVPVSPTGTRGSFPRMGQIGITYRIRLFGQQSTRCTLLRICIIALWEVIMHITQFMSITQIIDIPSIITHIPRVMVKIKSIKRIKSNYAGNTRVPHCAVPGCSGIIYNIMNILLIMRGMSKKLRNWREVDHSGKAI